MAVLVCFIVSLIEILCNAQDTLDKESVTISLGTVIGLHVNNSNIEYYSFKGIPYANVTERFKAPSPMTPWQTTVMAFDDGPKCPQPTFSFETFDSHLPEDEQCLYMNIFTPKLPQKGESNHPKLPVIVYIHGSGFLATSSSSTMYGPEYFMEEKNVVIVAFNYRLGVFGFLSTGTKDAQGNAGLKDQVEALKWVKREISHFGGDPSRVTIFGTSAGAASVVLHLISPMSKGLFHAAIAQSGAALADWTQIEASVACERATRIAELLYCNTENTTTIVNCLRKMSVSAINDAVSELMAERTSVFVTVPATETGEYYEDAFLPDSSSNLFDNLDASSSVPLIIGTDKDEGMMMLFFGDEMYEYMDIHLDLLIPLSIKKHSTPEQLSGLVQKLRQYYFNGGPVNKTSIKGYVDVWGDYLFVYPTAQTVRKLVAKRNDVYLYNFVYKQKTANPYWNKLMPNLDYEGVTHGADCAFYFYSPSYLGMDLSDTESDDYRMRKRLIKLWTTFAKTGSPVSTTDETIKDIQWPKVPNTLELTYLEINNTFTIGKNYYEGRVAVWDQLTSNSDALHKDEL